MYLQPRWAIGHHQSRWDYNTEEQVRELAAKLRERHHPCDSIWLDIDYMDGYRCFTWDPQRFPHPEQMTKDLHEQRLHVVTIVDPGIKIDDNYFVYQQGMEHDYFCRYENGQIFKGSVWPGLCVFPDFSRSDVRNWWGNLQQVLLDEGVDGIWNDMNEPAITSLPSQAEEQFATGMTMCLNVSMSGVPFVGVDIGGFWNASNGELLVRFAQLGALLPFCRNHNATDNPGQEPWAFGEPYESAYRNAIEQRYRLLPYLYTL